MHADCGATGVASASIAAKYNAFLNRWAFCQRLIDSLLKRQRLPAAPTCVGRDLQLGGCVSVAIRNRLSQANRKDWPRWPT